MNHYETLGVAKDATPEQIKQAFRRASSKAHPDKGGSDAQMAAVNQAYEVLSNTEHRARYDDTGNDQEERSLEDAARNVALQVIGAGIDSEVSDPIHHAQCVLLTNIGQAETDRKRCDQVIKRLERMRPKVKVMRGDNLAHFIIDQQLAMQRRRGEEIDKVLPMLRRAKELVDSHNFERPHATTTVTGASFNGISTGTGAFEFEVWHG